MLQKITLENFRCFDRHQVDFKNLSIAVGANNAGKSTLIEAIRIVSLAANRYRGLQYKRPPGWTNLPLREYGVSPALRMIDLRGGSIFHRYGEPPAKIIAEFAEGQKIKVLLNEDAVFAVLFDQDGSCITSKSHAKKKNFPAIKILPQIGPLVEEEKKLSDSHIHANLDSSIASRHFRNQLRLYPDQFAEFKQNARASWKGLDIKELVKEGDSPNEVLSLFVRDGNFSAEIGWMGHGIQMWLQTIWFLARCTTSDIVVLDEPDVYMHADLQRKLIRLLRGKNHQTIVATHSVEIMSEVDAEEILVVDKLKGRSRVATSVPAVQRVIENLGGVQNIHLARLWGSRKCIHVEGKDIDLLKVVQDKVCNDSEVSFKAVPRISIGGWGGWSYAIGSTMNIENAAGDSIQSYCVFDSDYHTHQAKCARFEAAKNKGIQLHIWSMKEIENYFIEPVAILRLIKNEGRKNHQDIRLSDIEAALYRITDDMENEVFDAFANEYYSENKSKGTTYANRKARAILTANWSDSSERLRLVSGKTVISKLSEWSHETFGFSFGVTKLARAIRPSEFSTELKNVVNAIDSGNRFPGRLKDLALSKTLCAEEMEETSTSS